MCVRQGSSLSPYLFPVVIYEVKIEIHGELPWCMMFVDVVVLVRENLEEDNNKLGE